MERRTAPPFQVARLACVGRACLQQAPPAPGHAEGKGRTLSPGDTMVACARNVAGRSTGAGIGHVLSPTDALLSPYCLQKQVSSRCLMYEQKTGP